jgi:CHAT domain-containing protein
MSRKRKKSAKKQKPRVSYSVEKFNQGTQQLMRGDVLGAVASFDKALHFKPNYPDAWFNRGVALFFLGQYEDAIASYNQALQIKPDDHGAWHDRGWALERLGQLEDAIASYNQALQIKPDFYMAWNNRGKAVQIEPDFHIVWHNRGNAVGQSLNYNPQAAIILQLQFPTSPPVTPNPTLTRRGYEGKLLCYQEGLKHCPKDTHPEGWGILHQALGNAHYFQGKVQTNYRDYVRQRDYWRQAVAEYQQALITLTQEAFPAAHLAVVRDLIRVLLGLGENTEAKRWRRQGLNVFGQLLNDDTSNESLKHLHNFENWVNDWNQQYQDYRKSKEEVDPPQPPLKRGENKSVQTWQDNLPNLLEQLSEILNIPAILSTLTHINQLILIPHRDLHRFPLHALFNHPSPSIGEGQGVREDFTITYLPSAQIGLNLQSESTQNLLPLLSVEHPDSKDFNILPHAEIESAAIAQLFNIPNESRISGQFATQTAIKNALTQNYKTFHFTGHGSYNHHYPKHSALFLSGEDKLTLENIFNLNLSGYHLVTLAGCETAITGNETIDNEYVGLVSAFVYQRVTYVVSTLWTVPDLASSLFMIYFYWQLKKGKPPTIALAKATKWLRNLSDRKLERLYKVICTKLPPEEKPLRPFIRHELYKLRKMEPFQKNQKPFNHPYYWAAFTITGGE